MKRIVKFSAAIASVLLYHGGVAQEVAPINLTSVLKLVRADNLDVKLAQERINEAKANHASALAKFLPWISAGLTWRRHEGTLQSADGTLINTDKDSTSIGPTITAQVDLGDAWFSTLAAKQVVIATEAAYTAGQQDSTLAAVDAYFELLKASQLVAVNQEALSTSQGYEQQLQAGVSAGVIFKGDWLRAQTQTQRYQATVLQAKQQQRIAAARLSELLHLDPVIELMPDATELAPITLVNEASVEQQITIALEKRAEIKQSAAQLAAAREVKKNAVYGPLIPSVGAQAFIGDLSGGKDGASNTNGNSRDYSLGINWRIGPGGLFDFSRLKAANSKLNSAAIQAEKIRNNIKLQVIEARAKLSSSNEQLSASRNSMTAAIEALRLTRERKQLGVGMVLEDIQAQQELVRARSDYLNALTEHNKAQYELQKAIGEL